MSADFQLMGHVGAEICSILRAAQLLKTQFGRPLCVKHPQVRDRFEALEDDNFAGQTMYQSSLLDCRILGVYITAGLLETYAFAPETVRMP